MHHRRSFLKISGKALGGLFFCGCGLAHSADTKDGIPKRITPVFINGRRVKTIDVHAHCMFQDAIDLMGDEAKSVPPPTKGVPEHFININKRIQHMDAQGIDMQVLSMPLLAVALPEKTSQMQNIIPSWQRPKSSM